ncbi:MAG TPA: hypothetical protein VJI12_04500 [archaeon]|nr:hypothetical protein [archaeon]
MKGQWFIISAVVASSIFFGISVMMKDYFVLDSSQTASMNSDYYFYNIQNQFNKIVATTVTNVNCINLTTNLNEFKTVTEKSLAGKGYFALLEYQVTPPCGANNIVKMDLIIADGRQTIYNFSTYSNVNQIIGAA